MSRGFAIDEAIVLAVITSRQLTPELHAELKHNDSIRDLEVHTGQEDEGNRSVIPEAVVHERHLRAADQLQHIRDRPISASEMRAALTWL